FFSSRRRHTRCYRDWSSDVCSSDLVPGVEDESPDGRAARHEGEFTAPESSRRECFVTRRPHDPTEREEVSGQYPVKDDRDRVREIGRASCREGEEVGERGEAMQGKR